MEQILPSSLVKEPAHPNLDSEILASRTVREYTSVVLLTQFAVICYCSPWKPVQPHLVVLGGLNGD